MPKQLPFFSKKRYIILLAVVVLVILGLSFLPLIAKNYINKHSVELSGRKIWLEDLDINYFKVAVRAENLVMYESNQTDTFAGFKEFYINFDPLRLLSNEYSFSAITIDSLFVNIEQGRSGFNFDDLIPEESDTVTIAKDSVDISVPFRFAIHNLKLLNSRIDYYDKSVDSRLVMDDLQLDLPLIAWDSESSDMGIDFEFGEQGKVHINGQVNQSEKSYSINLKVDQLGLEPFTNYLSDFINIQGMSGFFNSHLTIKGHMENTEQISLNGIVGVDAFKLLETDQKELISIESAKTQIKEINLADANYQFTDITIEKPIVHVELEDSLTNWEKALLPIMGESSDSTEIVENDSIQQDDLKYSIDKISINNGQIAFLDHTLNRPFHYDIKDIKTELSSLNEQANEVPFQFSLNMNDQGAFEGNAKLDLVTPTNFQMKAQLQRLRLMSFSPYTEYYIARPITNGDLSYDLSLQMTENHLENSNDILIREMEFGSKTGDKALVKAPVKLGLYLMKDPKDRITIKLPVEGNPSDPDFSLGKIIWKAFSNLLIKTAASPFNALSNLVSTRPEELEQIPFEFTQDSLYAKQYKVLDKIADILERKPQLVFSFEQQTDISKEKEKVAIKMMKSRLLEQTISRDAAVFGERLANMSDNDPYFLTFLQKESGREVQNVANVCVELIGQEDLNNVINKLLIFRNRQVKEYLCNDRSLDATSVEVMTADLRNIPAQLKKPNFKVEVSVK